MEIVSSGGQSAAFRHTTERGWTWTGAGSGIGTRCETRIVSPDGRPHLEPHAARACPSCTGPGCTIHRYRPPAARKNLQFPGEVGDAQVSHVLTLEAAVEAIEDEAVRRAAGVCGSELVPDGKSPAGAQQAAVP